MKARRPKSVRHLLNDKPTLKLLQLEISAQKALLHEVRSMLPADLAIHCVAAQMREQHLVIHTDAAVWATRLRYMAPQLLSLLQSRYPSLSEIKTRLLQTSAPRSPAARQALRSDAAATIILDSAHDTKQTALREALTRLGRALKNK